jgi:nitroreductase/NAD-dependent dihydropyrimidine dehydrogenase PreA subunit
MITIDSSKCVRCGDCRSICHASAISHGSESIEIDYTLCSTCCQCIACCPAGALSWDGIKSRKIVRELLPEDESLIELLKARHSIRSFKDKPVEREKLEKICATAKLAPTNNYDIELIVVHDVETIAKLEEINLSYIKRVNSLIYKNPLIFKILKLLTTAVNDTDRKKIKRTLMRGNIFQEAPVLIILAADPKIQHTEQSCQYVMYNMILTAQTIGLGSCISGAGKSILAKSKRAEEILGIPKGKKIQGILFLGYPAVSFTKSVEGNLPKIKWIQKKSV